MRAAKSAKRHLHANDAGSPLLQVARGLASKEVWRVQPSAGQYVLQRVGIGLEQMNLLRANEISMQMRCTHSESTKNGLSLSRAQ